MERQWSSLQPCPGFGRPLPSFLLILDHICIPHANQGPLKSPAMGQSSQIPATAWLLGQSPQRGTAFLASRPPVDFTHQGQGNLLLPQLLGPGASKTGNVFQSWGLPSLLHKTPLFLSLTGNLYCSRAPDIPTACFLQTCTSEDGFGCGLESGGPQRHNTHERILNRQTATT